MSPSSDEMVQIPVKAPDIIERDWEIPSAAPGGPARSEALRGEFREAVRSKPREYEPRTHHLRPDRSPLYVNRLIRETSPYLLQHAHNPVDWHPWGDEAFALARSLGRPVLLSVGYSTCHWCHVMERESFEDLEIATFINSHFVPIKVDREERPDVDAVYMQVVQMLTGRGGWPMTVILTPDRQPIFGGTYFPARDGDRGSATGFLTVLQTLSARYAENPESVVAEAAEVARRLQAASASRPAAGVPGARVVRAAVEQLSSTFDSTFGGFGRAPKFPRSVTLEFLLRYHRRTRDPNALHMAVYTLERMAASGMRDHVGGGFHRYSTDARWLVPHFEKMLYDNALLVVAYLEGYQASARKELLAVAEDTLHYVAREMTDVRGGFYSATDADSAGPEGIEEEGRFFTWTDEEIDKAVGTRDAELVMSAYGVSKQGNYENGRTILHTSGSMEVAARKAGVSVDVARKRLEEARQSLYDVRAERTPPLKDTKIIAGWNGLMISAFARVALATGNSSYAQRATRAAEFVATEFVDADGRLARVWKDGKASHAGVLEDYAFVVAGLLDLFEASSELRWLDLAVRLQQRLDEDFADRKGGYFLTATDGEELLVRLKPDYDGAVPSGNSVAVMNLLRLGELLGEERYRAQAEKALRAFSAVLERSPAAVPKLLCALDFYLDQPKEIVVVVADYEQGVPSFIERLGTMFLPNRSLVVTRGVGQTRNLVSRVPLLEGKVLLDDRATAYVCENRVCKRPTNSVDTFAAELEPVTPYP